MATVFEGAESESEPHTGRRRGFGTQSADHGLHAGTERVAVGRGMEQAFRRGEEGESRVPGPVAHSCGTQGLTDGLLERVGRRLGPLPSVCSGDVQHLVRVRRRPQRIDVLSDPGVERLEQTGTDRARAGERGERLRQAGVDHVIHDLSEQGLPWSRTGCRAPVARRRRLRRRSAMAALR